MTPLVLGALAAWSIWSISGVGGRYPWRIAELSPATPRAPRRNEDLPALERDLPAATDLLRVAATAGHTVHGAVSAVGLRGTGPVAAALRSAIEEFDRGVPLADSLAALPDRFGDPIRPLTTTLVMAMETGDPLEPALSRLAERERRRLRRRSEERVRRLPVALLVPLVTLVLPAFVLLAIVPVALTTVTQLSSPDSAASPGELSPQETP